MLPATISLPRLGTLPARPLKEHGLDGSRSSEHTDMELVRRIAAGDGAALRALYALYGQRLFAYALRLVRDRALAQDIVQESLVAAWQGASRFRGEARVIAWLLGIVHHKALNAIRRTSPALLDDEDERYPDPALSLDEQIAGGERADLLRGGLESLSLNHRMVLELVFYQGLNLAEVAAVCGCPVGTVKSRLNYAKQHLRRVLEQTGFDAEELRS